MISNPFISKLRHGVALSDQEEHLLVHLAASSEDVSADCILVKQGRVPDAIYVMKDGIAARLKTLPDGRKAITGLILPGDLSSASMASNKQLDHSIIALSRCNVVKVARQDLETLANNFSRISEALLWADSIELNMLREWLVNMSLRNADARMAHFFCEILVRLQSVGLAMENSFTFPLAQVDLANVLGMSAVHINRTLQELRSARLIVFAKRLVTIPDPNRLKAFAQFSPDYLCLHQPRNI